MRFYIDAAGNYWEGDIDGEGFLEVTQRPDANHDWDGAAWVENTARKNAAINAPIIAQLDAIDLKSIRALREGDAARVGALEAQAAELRLLLAK